MLMTRMPSPLRRKPATCWVMCRARRIPSWPSLIDAEERLYAILESPTVEMERPKITIVLKRTFFQAQPNEQGQGIILPFPPPKKKKYE